MIKNEDFGDYKKEDIRISDGYRESEYKYISISLDTDV